MKLKNKDLVDKFSFIASALEVIKEELNTDNICFSYKEGWGSSETYTIEVLLQGDTVRSSKDFFNYQDVHHYLTSILDSIQHGNLEENIKEQGSINETLLSMNNTKKSIMERFEYEGIK